ncbi:hypothetical protein Vi05172_g4339 [Venturia inaequalis]|nr:hypothetical protein Vi05172_g4339 [Venturia inaequalis]
MSVEPLSDAFLDDFIDSMVLLEELAAAAAITTVPLLPPPPVEWRKE